MMQKYNHHTADSDCELGDFGRRFEIAKWILVIEQG